MRLINWVNIGSRLYRYLHDGGVLARRGALFTRGRGLPGQRRLRKGCRRLQWFWPGSRENGAANAIVRAPAVEILAITIVVQIRRVL